MGNELNKTVKASELAGWCGVKWIGVDTVIHKVTSLSAPEDGALCFTNAALAEKIPCGVVLIGTVQSIESTECLLLTESPRLTFAKSLMELEKRVGFRKSDARPIIHPTAKISTLAFIAPGVVIGAGTVVLPFAYIGEDTVIGEGCVIKSGAVIGQDGFGFERDESGAPLRLIHLGKVVIGNDVEIGSGTTVCRGTLADTVIEDFAKIDDHVHIAHNVKVGWGAMVIACAEVSGGVVIGDKAWIGPNASIIQKITIGQNSLVGIGANITKSVPENVVVAGNPARILRGI